MLVFLSVIENKLYFVHIFCCFRPRASTFHSQFKRAVEPRKIFIMPGHYKKSCPLNSQSDRAYYCSHIINLLNTLTRPCNVIFQNSQIGHSEIAQGTGASFKF